MDTINYVEQVKSVSHSQGIVARILRRECPLLSVCFRHGVSGSHFPVSLVAVNAFQDRIYLFDVRNKPELVIEGGLARLFQAHEIVKVVFGAADEIKELEKEFGVHSKNIFDVFFIFQGLLIDSNLPQRKISLKNLFEKVCVFGKHKQDEKDLFLQYIDDAIIDDYLYWSKRPLSKSMIKSLGASCEALEQIYRLLRHLGDSFHECSQYTTTASSTIRVEIWWSERTELQKQNAEKLRKEIKYADMTLLEDCEPYAKFYSKSIS